MRTSSAILVGLSLLTLASSATPGFYDREIRHYFERRPSRVSNVTWEVVGYGENEADAEQDALSKACVAISEMLERNNPALAWTPSASYLKQRGFIKSRTTSHEELEKSGPVVAVRMSVSIGPQLLEDAQRETRHQRMVARQHGLALGFGGALAGLLVLCGYLRLEEATRGSYTRLLRFTALGTLVLVGVGLFMAAMTTLRLANVHSAPPANSVPSK